MKSLIKFWLWLVEPFRIRKPECPHPSSMWIPRFMWEGEYYEYYHECGLCGEEIE